ncbi:MAG: T9SS type A sorting domain-containing protein [Ignavibacteriales bacterium]|nr:T9SS type A sorting domain-containing protein [Ignavibacteriales bacterium]
MYSVTGDTLLSYRQAHGSQGYLSQDEPVLHFGCGNRDQVKVKVVFLNNNHSTFEFISNTNRNVSITDFYPDLVAPSKPTNFILNGFLDKVELSWNKNPEGDVEKYNIYRSTTANFDPDTMATFTYAVLDTVFTDTNVVYGNSYYYSIAAVDTAGNKSDYSEILAVSIADTIAPEAPTGLKIVLTDESTASLSWNKNLEGDVEKYQIYRSMVSNFDPDTMDTFTYSTTDTFYVDVNVDIDKHYYYKISAVDIHENNSEFSSEVNLLITDIVNNNVLPTKFELSQNYPNPFNPVTKISYQIPQSTKLKIVVYDMLGNEVKILENGYKEAGYYNLEFDGSKYSSGIYFYKMIAGSFVETKKFVLIK